MEFPKTRKNKKIGNRFVVAAMGVCAINTLALADGEVKIAVNLSPAGSFLAQSTALQVVGFERKQGDVLLAKDIILDLNALKTGIPLRDQHMKTKYFETSKYPKATLTHAEGRNGKFSGELMIRNVKKKIEGTYSIEAGQFDGKFKCKLSDFKIASAKYMGVGVDDEVEVEVLLPIKNIGGTPVMPSRMPASNARSGTSNRR